MMKLIIPVIVISAVVGGWFVWTNQQAPAPVATNTEKVATPAPVEQAPVAATTPDTGISAGATADADLSTDLSTLDGQILAAAAGSASIDQSLNDKSTQ